MTRPWRVVAPDGTIVATSSTFSEAEIAHRDGDTLQQLDTQHEWQDASSANLLLREPAPPPSNRDRSP
jgi:hypothetical protein